VRRAALAALLALGACASPPPKPVPTPAAPPPIEAAVPAPPQSPAPGPGADTCGALDMQRYVGRPRTELPAPVYPDRVRVACTTCPVTLDHRPERLNVFFDAATGVIKEIKCG
jgi:hypothetical protein